jgi:SAM-dependent methyltransferase
MPDLLRFDNPAGAYARLASHYNGFTAGYDHDRWVDAIEVIGRSHGQLGRRALDIGCGTGRSTAPLFDRGYSVLACDISPEMIRIARASFPAHRNCFFVADMRKLPELGEFDLILCLDDALNYLTSDVDLAATFRCVAGLLSATGMFVFDVNSLRTYRTAFAGAMVRESEGRFFAWRGEADASVQPGGTAAATLEVFAQRDDGLWERSSSRHVQRHHAEPTIRRLLRSSGLHCVSAIGQSRGVQLDSEVDEGRHTKVVYFARPAQVDSLMATPHPDYSEILD